MITSLRQSISRTLSFISVLWLAFILKIIIPLPIFGLGIIPREPIGLLGIATTTFVHANLSHLIANTSALFVLMLIAHWHNQNNAAFASTVIIISSGLCVWLFGTPKTNHIGASNLVFGLIGYLLFIGIFRKEWISFLVSAIIAFLYGGALLQLLHIEQNVSWSSHFFGFLSGILAAKITEKRS